MQRTALLAALALCPLVRADTIFSSGDPFGWPDGPTGSEVCSSQSAAIRFTPARDCTATSVSLWLMSSVPAALECAPVVVVSLREGTDEDGMSTPTGRTLESWTRGITASGPSPVLESFQSSTSPVLRAGRSYWVVAESATVSGRSPVWNRSHDVTGFVAISSGRMQPWNTGDAPALAVLVEGRPACGSEDFDGDGDAATDGDIEAYFACLAGSCCARCGSPDFDGDGDSGTDGDIEAFFRVLAGGAC